MSMSGSVLAVLLFMLKPLMRNRLPKSVQYYLWLVVVFALLVPVSDIIVLPENQTASGTETPVIQAIQAVPTISETVNRFIITQGEQYERIQNITPIAGIDTSDNSQESRAAQNPIVFIATYFMMIYPFGVLLFGLYYVINYMFFARLYRRRNFAAGAEAENLLTQMCGGRVPHIYRNPLATTPMLLGTLRPAIILPDKEYSAEQLEAILSHELIHLRRKDIFVKWLTLIASALHWFNPVLWLIRREIDRSCELSCDEAVISSLNPEGKQNYGNTLIEVSASCKTSRAVTSVTMCEEKKNLKERLGAIMKSKKHTRIALIISVLLIFLTVGSALTLGAGRREGEIEPWIQAYTELLLDNMRLQEMGINIPYFKLIDVDFNGIPELFITGAYHRSPSTLGLYTYTDGLLTELTLPVDNDWMPWDIVLYRDTRTNEFVWMSFFESWSLAGSDRTFLWYEIDFDDLSSINAQFHFGFRSFWGSQNPDDEDYMSSHYFWVLEDDFPYFNNHTVIDSGEDILQMLEDSFSYLETISPPVLYRQPTIKDEHFEWNETNLMEYISSRESPPASQSPFDFDYWQQRLGELASASGIDLPHDNEFTNSGTWRDAYMALLRNPENYDNEDGHHAEAFDLADIDNNGVPELIIAYGDNVTGSYIFGNVYSFNDAVYELGTVNLYYRDAVYSNSIVFPGLFTDGGRSSMFYADYWFIEDDELKNHALWEFIYDGNQDGSNTYRELSHNNHLIAAATVAFESGFRIEFREVTEVNINDI
jgi:beta-lactamase regulating signal transducer with metallopeptidase domain